MVTATTTSTASPAFLTAQQFADEMQLSVFTVWRLIREGQLKAAHISRSVRIPRTELDCYIDGGTGTDVA